MKQEVQEQQMPLTRAPQNSALKIVDIDGGERVRQFLGRLGLRIGSNIRILQGAPFSGPLLLSHRETHTAVGRGMAQKIIVEVTE